jgi:penicillin-binding protein 1C
MKPRWKILLPSLAGLALFLYWPMQHPQPPFSTVLNDADGYLMGATVATDGQWRFPQPDSVPLKIRTCIRYFEDEYFYYHPGINPVSLVRATWQNARQKRVVSGASTLTMQIARMRGGRERTLGNKLIELGQALRLEARYSKKTLMTMYASMAPFGGNVVGVEAASWRYFGRPPHLLSWAESATLAVLPNQPSAVYPGMGDSTLLHKRNRLLKKLLQKQVIDQLTYDLSLLEPIPGSPFPISARAPHLLATYAKTGEGTVLNSTLDPFWQQRVHQLAEQHQLEMDGNGVDNLAVLVVDLSDGRVLAYKGNTDNPDAEGRQVDILQRRRSPGSTLKPLLYATAMDKGLILRRTLLPDVPMFFGGFVPRNFNRGYAGAIPANQALSRSLNIGFVHLLRQYTYEQFHHDLQSWGITTLDKPAGHYGLSLILGGCEVTPWELSQVYFSMYRRMAGLPNRDIHFDGEQRKRPSVDLGQDALWHMFNAMTVVARPEGERSWRTFTSSQLIAWKTGTSYGFRDAWAIGLNGNVLITVWVGNADGEGRPELTGLQAAAPLMLQLMRQSPHDPAWLKNLKPFMPKQAVCKLSGMLANPHCPAVEEEVPSRAETSGLCPYHQPLVMDASGQYRVNSGCYALAQSTTKVAFVLPPAMGHYYRLEHAGYEGLPPDWPGCASTLNPLEILYPRQGARVFIPRELSGEKGRVVLQASHQDATAALHWHIGGHYLATTTKDHQLPIDLSPGFHQLTIMDASGNTRELRFEVVGE